MVVVVVVVGDHRVEDIGMCPTVGIYAIRLYEFGPTGSNRYEHPARTDIRTRESFSPNFWMDATTVDVRLFTLYLALMLAPHSTDTGR